METDESNAKEFCANCHVGSLKSWRATYARWHGGKFVIVPGMSSWRCDFCGETFYDDQALYRLALLLGRESDLADRQKGRAPGLEGGWEIDLGSRHGIG